MREDHRFVQSVAERIDLKAFKEVDRVDINLPRTLDDIEGLLTALEDKKEMGLLDSDDIKHIEMALSLMIQLHIGQADRADGSGPFIKHPIEVASGVLETYDGSDLASVTIAALLHDTIEDQSKLLESLHVVTNDNSEDKSKNKALDALEQAFGHRVSVLVGKVSTPPVVHDLDLSKLKSRVRKKKASKYISFIKGIVEDVDDPAAFVIKWQDAKANMLTIGNIWESTIMLNKRVVEIVPAPNPEIGSRDHDIKKAFESTVQNKEAIYKKLRDKYKPVLEEVLLPAFETMQESHPLFEQRGQAITDIKQALNEQYNLDELGIKVK